MNLKDIVLSTIVIVCVVGVSLLGFRLYQYQEDQIELWKKASATWQQRSVKLQTAYNLCAQQSTEEAKK